MFDIESLEDDLDISTDLNLPKDVDLYWIHCNICFETYIQKRRRILLLSCNHTICEKCVAAPSVNTANGLNQANCPLCHKVQRFRVLCNIMPTHVNELLNPEPWNEPTERVLDFQTKQRKIFKKGMSRKHSKLKKMKRKRIKLKINTKRKYEKLDQLKYERKQLEMEVRKYKEREQKPQSMYFQLTDEDSFDIDLSNMNEFPRVKRRKTDFTPRHRRHNSSDSSDNSFTLSLF